MSVTFESTTLATPPVNTVIATDQIGGVDFQRAKLTWGTTGTAVDASTGSPIPVQVTSVASSTAVIGAVMPSTQWTITTTPSSQITVANSSSTGVIGAVMPSTQWTVSVTPTTQFSVTTTPSSQQTVSVTPTTQLTVANSSSTGVIGAVMPSTQWTVSVTPTTQFTVTTTPSSQQTVTTTPSSQMTVSVSSSTAIFGAVMPSTQWTVTTTPSSQMTVSVTPTTQLTVANSSSTGVIGAVMPSTQWTVANATSTGVIGAVMASTNLPVDIANYSYANSLPASAEANTVYNGVTACAISFATITTSSSGATMIASAVASKNIKVLSAQLTAGSSVSAIWISSTGSTGGNKTGYAYLASNAGYVLPFNPLGWFQTNSGEGLNIFLSGPSPVGGSISFIASS